MVISIEDLFFGVPAAERDDDLIACFVTSETYNRLSQGNGVPGTPYLIMDKYRV